MGDEMISGAPGRLTYTLRFQAEGMDQLLEKVKEQMPGLIAISPTLSLHADRRRKSEATEADAPVIAERTV